MHHKVHIIYLALAWMIGFSGFNAQGEWSNPLDYGAVGDGVANDWGEIQQALNTDGTVHLAGRRYLIKKSLTIPAGGGLHGPGTLIVDFDNATAGPTNAALVLNGDHVTVEGLHIQKQFIDGSLASGVFAAGGQDIHLSELTIEGYSAGSGIHLYQCSNFEISNCRIHHFLMDANADLFLHPMAGIHLEECELGLVQHNTIDHIEVGSVGRAVVPSSASETGPQGYRSHLIHMNQSHSIAINNNLLFVGGVGVNLVDSQDCMVAGNKIRDTWSRAIQCDRTSFCVANGNQVQGGSQAIRFDGDLVDDGSGGSTPGTIGIPVALAGVVGSVEGGDEDSANEGDTLAHISDENFFTRASIGQTAGSNEASFVLDLLSEQELHGITLVSERSYRAAGQFAGGLTTIETSNQVSGPWTDGGSTILECSRPTAGGMTAETIGAAATQTEARRIVLDEPALTRYVRLGTSYCLDNALLFSEAFANHGPVVHRLRPLGSAYGSTTRLPIHMTDSDTNTYCIVKSTAGSVDIDIAPIPVEMTRIRLVGVTGALGNLPQSGSIWVSALDQPDQISTLVDSFDIEQSNGEVVIDLPAGLIKRFVRIEWATLQDDSDTETRIAEIEVEFDGAFRPGDIDGDPTQTSVANSISANMLLDTGAPGFFEIPAADRVAGDGVQGVVLTGGATYNIVNNQTIMDRQDPTTLESGIERTGEGFGNLVVDNLVSIGTTIATDVAAPLPPSAPRPPTPAGTINSRASDWLLYSDQNTRKE